MILKASLEKKADFPSRRIFAVMIGHCEEPQKGNEPKSQQALFCRIGKSGCHLVWKGLGETKDR